jgi:hypothetical protein
MGLSTGSTVLVILSLSPLGQTPDKAPQAPRAEVNQKLVATGPSGKSMPLDLTSNQWTFRARGPWQDMPDRRGLRAMRYPWHISDSGEQVELSRSVTIPADWQPPYTLTFFCSDDYSDYRERPQKAGNSIDSYVGHRFKEVLIDGRVVWERDIADDSAPGTPTDFSVDLKGAKPGQTVVVTLRNVDRVGLNRPLPTDFYLRGIYEPADRPGGGHVLATTCYWGDVTLWSSALPRPPACPRPSSTAVHAAHTKQWPYPPAGREARLPVSLALEGLSNPPGGDTPIICGVPLPEGCAKSVNELSLQLDSRPLTWQPEVMNRWPDGSVRWVLVNTVLPAGTRAEAHIELVHAPMPPSAAAGARMSTSDDGKTIKVRTTDLDVVVGGASLIDSVRCSGQEVCRGLQPAATWLPAGGPARQLAAKFESVRLIRNGPVRATIEARGMLADTSGVLGPIIVRIDAFANVPALRITYRLFNSGADRADLTSVRLAGNLSAGEGRWSLSGGNVGEADMRLAQVDRDHYAVTAAGRKTIHDGHADGWIATGAGQRWMRATVRHFWQQFPAAMEVTNERLSLEFVAGSEAAPAYGCRAGEAKRWETWLTFGSGRPEAATIEQGNRTCMRPVRLFNSAYFCATDGLGQAYPHDKEFAPVAEHMAKTYPGASHASMALLFGVRDFGDSYYTEKTPTYRNNYYDVMRGMFGEYLMGCDENWFDRGEEAALHYMDIDQFHESARTHDQRGANASVYTPNHNDDLGIWPAMLRPAGGMLTYWRLSGDEDARESALMLADYIVRTHAGKDAGSVRDNAGPLHSLVWAFDETGDVRYRDSALEIARSVKQFLIPRRGCYAEFHGSMNYRGNVPWMVAQLCEPLYLLYRQSGQEWLADMVVGLMESVVCENMEPARPGNFQGYTHDPVLHRGGWNSGYNVLIAPCAGLAFELSGEQSFLEIMRGAYRITVEEKTINSVQNCYWMTPTLLYHLHRHRQP